MARVASLYLPQLAIERLRRAERSATPPEARGSSGLPGAALLAQPIDDQPGACSVPRGGGWRPGARWARGDREGEGASDAARIAALPAHQRPSMREMGRRSEYAGTPFRGAGRGDGVARSRGSGWAALWGRPTICVDRVGQQDVVTAACPEALALGLRPGMAAAHARALVADLDVREAEPQADRAILDRLALHAVGHWTPTACVSGVDGLWLDLSGTTHLFGGEQRFGERLLRFLERLGFTATIAIAGTPGAAHALARYGGQPLMIVPEHGETEALGPLPLAALRLSADALQAAARFGIEQIADLYSMPRGPLAKRLGLDTVRRLDQARGLVAEPIIPFIPFETPRVMRRLLEPIGSAEAIAQVIGDLVTDLVALLEARGEGLRSAVLTCLIVDGGEQRVAIGTARATRDPGHLARMFRQRIERIDPGLGIEAMSLAALRVEPLGARAITTLLEDGDAPPDLAPLVDQLAGRGGGGEAALFHMTARESDVPERAVAHAPMLETVTGWPGWMRPIRLLSRPEPLSHVVALLPDHPPRRFTWRGVAHAVIAGDGPERIHGEWWRRAGEMWAVRDYFRVETTSGERFWLFRRGDGVDGPTGDLSWHIHGIFG